MKTSRPETHAECEWRSSRLDRSRRLSSVRKASACTRRFLAALCRASTLSGRLRMRDGLRARPASASAEAEAAAAAAAAHLNAVTGLSFVALAPFQCGTVNPELVAIHVPEQVCKYLKKGYLFSKWAKVCASA